jgi:Leucine-rich repeat (LRR) protein
MPTNAIEPLLNLKILVLSQNHIKYLPFPNNPSLLSLDLSYNFINELNIQSLSISSPSSLENLYLQNNELTWSHFNYLLLNLPNLQQLNLDFNKLSSSLKQKQLFLRSQSQQINETIVILKLQTLSIQGNQLTELNLQQLIDGDEYSNQDNNKWWQRQTRRRRFTFNNLIKLNLARNRIKFVPNEFFRKCKMNSLNTLVLDKNPLFSELKGTGLRQQCGSNQYFVGLEQNLLSLSLSNVGAAIWSPGCIDSLLIRLDNLKTLKLNGNIADKLFNNDQQSMQNIFNKNTTSSVATESLVPRFFPSLNVLELQHNNLKRLPEFVCSLNNLNDLDLSSNLIETIDLNCFKFGFDY